MRFHRCFLACALAGALPLCAWAQRAVPTWQPHVDVEAKPGTKRNLGEADFFLPLAQDGRSLWFGNARFRIGDHDNREGNLGLGYRRMLEGGWNLGGYGYGDRRRSPTGNKFNQVTLGAEALGRDWDLRGNVYLPQGERVRDMGTTTVGGGTSAAIVGTTVQVTTAGSTTLRTEERALKGHDVEVGWRTPIWNVEDDTQLRLYLGGYRFSDAGVRVSGPRARAELTLSELPVPWKGTQLTFGVEVQDDNARPGQVFLSARLRIPLGSDRDSGARMNWQQRRMTAPVVRDVDVVTQASSTAIASTPARVEAATQTAGGQPFTVLSSGTTTGAALPGEVAAAGAGSTVILSGTFNTTATTALQDGQTLMAGTIGVRTPSGVTANLSSPATIAATVSGGAAVTAANNSTLRGLTVSNTGSAGTGATGVRVFGATGVTIAGTTITASELGVNSSNGIFVGGGSSAIISGNTISAVGNNNAGVATAVNVFAGSTVTIAGNVLSGSGSSNPGFNRFLGFQAGVVVNTGASVGNTAAAGVCLNAGAVGSVGFADGSSCP